jgi:hypothetical protein
MIDPRNNPEAQHFHLERIDTQEIGARVKGLHHTLTTDEELEQFAHILHISGADVSLTIGHQEEGGVKGPPLFIFESPSWPLVLCLPVSLFDRLIEALDCGHLEAIVSGLYSILNEFRREHGEPPRVRRTHPQKES